MSNIQVTKQVNGVYDVSFNASGDINLVYGIDEIIQDITTNLYLIKSEWFIDRNAGVDYFGVVFEKGSTRTAVDEQFIRAIEDTTGVLRIITYSSNIKRSTRELDVTFSVATTLGDTEELGVQING